MKGMKMKRKQLKVVVGLSILTALYSNVAWADGFGIPEQGARAMGVAGAFTAVANDLSAIYYNPAGLTQMEPGIHIAAGGTFILFGSEYQTLSGSGKRDSVQRGQFPPHLYSAYVFDNKKMALGLGIFAPYGLGVDWGSRDVSKWNGRYNVVAVDLKTVFINPTFVFKPVPELSIAVGASAVLGIAELKRQQIFSQPPTDDGSAHMGATGASFAANVGLLWKPMEELAIGLTWRSHSHLFLGGNVDFTVPATFATSFPDQTATTKISLPNKITFGAAYKVTKEIELSLNFDYTFWSIFDQVVFKFPNVGGAPAENVYVENWKDSFTVRLGASWNLNPSWQLRCGFLFDSTPVPDDTLSPLLPDQARFGASVGFGWKTGSFSLDWAFMALFFTHRTGTASNILSNSDSLSDGPYTQKYYNSAYLSGLTLGYKF
ncbi:MAG: outer membrane protein transport protein [Deltaproteobacteria bacterium]|nr:outer membrane protein transport protein [Deltaproteobacteria bacterium]